MPGGSDCRKVCVLGGGGSHLAVQSGHWALSCSTHLSYFLLPNHFVGSKNVLGLLAQAQVPDLYLTIGPTFVFEGNRNLSETERKN